MLVALEQPAGGAASPCGTGAGVETVVPGGTGTRLILVAVVVVLICHGANGGAIGGSGIVVIRYKFQ